MGAAWPGHDTQTVHNDGRTISLQGVTPPVRRHGGRATGGNIFSRAAAKKNAFARAMFSDNGLCAAHALCCLLPPAALSAMAVAKANNYGAISEPDNDVFSY